MAPLAPRHSCYTIHIAEDPGIQIVRCRDHRSAGAGQANPVTTAQIDSSAALISRQIILSLNKPILFRRPKALLFMED